MNQLSVHRLAGKAPRLAAALAIGAGVAAGGLAVSERAEHAAAAAIAQAEGARIALGRAMVEARLAPAAARLKELAELPLLADYLQLAESEADSVDAAELAAYLGEVFAAASEELEADALLVLTASGKPLLGETDPAALPEDAAAAEGVVLAQTEDGARLWWIEPVASIDDPAARAGTLAMRLAPGLLDGLGHAGLELAPPPPPPAPAPGSAAPAMAAQPNTALALRAGTPAPPPDFSALRVLALAAGFFAAVAAYFAAGAIRPQRTARKVASAE